MGDLLQPWHLIVLAVVAFLLFGAKRLPELGKGLGEGLKGFKEGLKGITEILAGRWDSSPGIWTLKAKGLCSGTGLLHVCREWTQR